MYQGYSINGRLPEPARRLRKKKVQFSAEYKLRIFVEAEGSTERGADWCVVAAGRAVRLDVKKAAQAVASGEGKRASEIPGVSCGLIRTRRCMRSMRSTSGAWRH